MSNTPTAIATLYLNRPVSGSEDHWVVQLDTEGDSIEPSAEDSEIPLYEGSILRIGRASSNDIVVRSKLASRFHALISVTRNAVVVCDLDSLNGSFVNGLRIEAPQDISNRDTLRIGPVEFHVHMNVARSIEKVETSEQRSEIDEVKVVLLLADIREYRQKLAESSPEVLTPLLRQWFATTREVLTGNGGSIDRFLGDGVLAYWVVGKEDDSQKVLQKSLRAAGELQARTRSLVSEQQSSEPWKCAISIVYDTALRATEASDHSHSLVLGSVLNELFVVNTFAKRNDIELSCNAQAADAMSDFVAVKSYPEIQTTAVVGERVCPNEIVAAKAVI